MPDFLAPVPMNDWLLWVVAIGFFIFAVFCNVVVAAPPVETRHTQKRFHWIAYSIIGVVVLLAMGII